MTGRLLQIAALAAGVIAGAWLAPIGVVAAESQAPVDDEVVLVITSPQPGQRLQGKVEITGYALDRRSRDGSGLNERDVAVYLDDSGNERNLFYYAAAGQDSPAAARTYGSQFAKVGFVATWDTCAFSPGAYDVIVWVSSLVTVGARNTQTVDVVVESCAPALALYQDDFATRPAGVYTVQLSPPSFYNGDGAPPIFGDFAAGIEGICTEPEPSCYYGLLFRVLPGPGNDFSSTGYAFFLDPLAGTYWLLYFPAGRDPSRFSFIIAPTAAPAIRRGAAWNRLGVVADGPSLRLYVNGEQVGETRDDSRPWGRIGWGASTEAIGRSVQARFDNFAVSTPGPPERLAAVLGVAEARPAGGTSPGAATSSGGQPSAAAAGGSAGATSGTGAGAATSAAAGGAGGGAQPSTAAAGASAGTAPAGGPSGAQPSAGAAATGASTGGASSAATGGAAATSGAGATGAGGTTAPAASGGTAAPPASAAGAAPSTGGATNPATGPGSAGATAPAAGAGSSGTSAAQPTASGGGAVAPQPAASGGGSSAGAGATAGQPAPSGRTAPFHARLDRLSELVERGDCQGAANELTAMFFQGAAQLQQAGLSSAEYQELETRAEQILYRMAMRCQ